MANNGKGARVKGSRGATTEVTLQELLRGLSLKAATNSLDFTQRLRALRDAFDGTALAAGEGSAVSRGPRRRPGEVVYEAVRLQLMIADELITFGQSQAEFWIDRAQRLGEAMLPPTQRPRLRLSATAAAGGNVAWSVHVFNAAHEVREVDLIGKWLKSGWDGAAPPPWRCEIDAASQRVPPRADRELTFRQSLGPDPVTGVSPFAPGRTYVARVSVRMRGPDGTTTPTLTVGRLELRVKVEGP